MWRRGESHLNHTLKNVRTTVCDWCCEGKGQGGQTEMVWRDNERYRSKDVEDGTDRTGELKEKRRWDLRFNNRCKGVNWKWHHTKRYASCLHSKHRQSIKPLLLFVWANMPFDLQTVQVIQCLFLDPAKENHDSPCFFYVLWSFWWKDTRGKKTLIENIYYFFLQKYTVIKSFQLQ